MKNTKLKTQIDIKLAKYKLQWTLLKDYTKAVYKDPIAVNDKEAAITDMELELRRFSRKTSLSDMTSFLSYLPRCFDATKAEEYVDAVATADGEGKIEELKSEIRSALEGYYLINTWDASEIGERALSSLIDDVKHDIGTHIDDVFKESLDTIKEKLKTTLVSMLEGGFDMDDLLSYNSTSAEYIVDDC